MGNVDCEKCGDKYSNEKFPECPYCSVESKDAEEETEDLAVEEEAEEEATEEEA